MAGGYSGQEIALDVNDQPLDIVSPLAKVQAFQAGQTENQYRSALTDSLVQSTSERKQLFPSQLQETQNTAALNTASTQRQQLGWALGTIDAQDPNASTKWDSAMRKLSAAGNPDADQYVGRYSPALQQRLTAAYGADNAMSALAGIGMSSTPDAQLTPDQTQAFDLRFGKATPQQLTDTAAHLDKMKDALNEVANSPNPTQAWAQLAPQFGHNEPFSWQAYKTAWNAVAPMDTYVRNRLQAQQSGAPEPVIPGQIVKAGDGSTVRVDAAGNVTPIAAAPGNWKPAGDGVSEINSRTGETRLLNGGAATGPAGPVFDQISQVAGGLGATGEDIAALRRQAMVESGGRANGPPSSTGRQGLFQFDQDTFNRFGGGDINSVQDQVRAGLNMLRSNRKLAAMAGADPSDANAYVVAQQGAGGGPALLSAARETPDAKAVDVLAPIYQAAGYKNARAVALEAVTKNGGAADMTASQFVGHIQDVYNRSSAAGAGGGNAGGGDSVVAPGFRFPVGYDEPTFQRMALQSFTSGKDPTFQRSPAAAQTQAAYRTYETKFMGFLGLSQSDLNDKATMSKAYGGAIAKLTGLQGQVNANEEAASRNADLALSKMQDMGQTPIPALNVLQMAARKGFGDPSVPAYQASLGTFLDEYAKVMSTSTGAGGQTSDSARNEAYSRVAKASNPQQLASVINTLKQDMANKQAGIQDSITNIRGQQRSLVPQTPAADVAQNPAAANWPGHTQAQLTAAQPFIGSKDPLGTQSNPAVINATGNTKQSVQTLINNHKPTQQNPLFVIDTQGFTHRFPPPANGVS